MTATTAESTGASFKDVIKAYVALTKPRIIELLLVTTLPAMFLAAGGLPPLWIAVATLVGGTFAAASANVFNCIIDRDIDEVMRRTRRRPMPRHQVGTVPASVFGVILAFVLCNKVFKLGRNARAMEAEDEYAPEPIFSRTFRITNPALAGRAALLASYAGSMTKWIDPAVNKAALIGSNVDVVTAATAAATYAPP